MADLLQFQQVGKIVEPQWFVRRESLGELCSVGSESVADLTILHPVGVELHLNSHSRCCVRSLGQYWGECRVAAGSNRG